MKAKNILVKVLAVVQIMSVASFSASADTSDIDYSKIYHNIKDFEAIEETPAKYLFNIDGSTREYIMLDTYDNNGEREFFVMTDYLAPNKKSFDADVVKDYTNEKNTNFYYMVKPGSGASWDSSAGNAAYDPENPNSVAYFINTDNFIDVMIDDDVDEYVTTHTWKSEPVWKEANITPLLETESKYALPAISEYFTYVDKIGRKVQPLNYTGSYFFHWYFRTPFADGSGSSYIMHKTDARIPNWVFSDYWDASLRPVFYLEEDFFKNVKLDCKTLGADVIKMIDFPSFMTRDEAKQIGYSDEEWAALSVVDIEEKTTDDYYITSNGNDRTKSGYTLTVNGMSDGDTVQFLKSTDGVSGFSIDGATKKDFVITNDLAKNYIAAQVTSASGEKYITNKILVGDNAKSYAGWINVPLLNETDDANWKLKFKEQPGEFTVVDYNDENGEILLMSGIAYKPNESEGAFYISDTNIQKYDSEDSNSIAWRINQEKFINDRIISTDYLPYIPEKCWETEKYFNGNDSVSVARFALPSLTELLSTPYIERIGYKIGSGTGAEAGFKLRTPYNSNDSFYYLRTATGKGSAQAETASSAYYPSRVEFYLNDDIFKVLKIDVKNSGAKAIDLAFSKISAEDAENAGYTSEELNAAGVNFPEVTNVRLSGMNTVGSTLTAKYIYTHGAEILPGEHKFSWYKVSESGDVQQIVGETSESYVIKQSDIGYKIYCTVKPQDSNGIFGLMSKTEESDVIEEGLCSLGGYSFVMSENQASVEINDLKVKDENAGIDIIFTSYDGYRISGQKIIKAAGNYSGVLSVDSNDGAYLVLAIINSKTSEPLVVITENESVVPKVEDKEGFSVTSYPSEEAIVLHGEKDGFFAKDDVVIKVFKKGSEALTYMGADKITEEGRLLHTFNFKENTEPGMYVLNVYKAGKSETLEFMYTTPEIKADIIVNELGVITEEKLANVLSENMQALEISDKYVILMSKSDLKAIGKLLEGKSYTEENITDFYNDLSYAAALFEITSNDDPKAVIEYYSDKFAFSESELNTEFGKLKNPDNVYKMFTGKTVTSFEDATKIYNESIVLQMINEAESYGIIADILDTYEKYLSCDLSDYKSSSKNKIALYIIENGCDYVSAEKLEEDIDSAIKKIKKNNSTVGGGGGASSGSSSRSNSVIISEPTPIQNPENTVRVKVFEDVSDDFWGYKYIAGLKEKNIISGTDTGMFYPDNAITREEFVKLIVLATNLPISDADCGFEDVSKDSWAYPYIATAFENGIVSGISDTTFGYKNKITRQDMAVMICRAMKVDGVNENPLSFKDADDIKDYAKESVEALVGTGIINGFEDNTFRGNAQSTRAEAATLIYRLITKD